MTVTEALPALPFLAHRDRRRSLLDDPRTDRGQYLLFADDDDPRLIPIGDERVRVGRGLTATIVLDDATVSRRHATIVRDGDALRLLDDNSTNGTYVNGHRIVDAALADGDVITFGRLEVVYRDTTPALIPA